MIRTLVLAEKSDALEKIVLAHTFKVDWVTSVDEAYKLVREPANTYGHLYFDPKLAPPLGMPLILQLLKQSPLCAFHTTKPHAALTEETAQRFKIRSWGAKVSGSSQAGQNAGSKLAKVDDDFVAIPLKTIASGAPLNFDVHVRVGKDHFVRLFSQGDGVELKATDVYLKRGIKEFFILQDQLADYTLMLGRYARFLTQRPEQNWVKEIEIVAAQGQLVFQALTRLGIDDKTLLLAREFLSNVEDAAVRINRDSKGALEAIWQNADTYDHAVCAVIVAAAFIEKCGFTHDRSVKNVGLACLLHDFSLANESEAVRSEDPVKMSEKELEIFHSHPLATAKTLGVVGAFDSILLQAIEQHHERRTTRGFPNKLGPGQIHPVAEIVGLCDEFVQLLKRDQNLSKAAIAVRMQNEIYQGFSSATVGAFDSAIIKRKT